MKNLKNIKVVSVIGATGNVGRQLVELLIQRNRMDPNNLRLFASKKSAGIQLKLAEHAFTIGNVANYDFKDCYLAIFATESDVSKKYIPVALNYGAKVVDASSAYRLDPKVPLIVPPVNANLITQDHQLYAHANCLASPISVVLSPLHEYAMAKRVSISTYQSVSGAGKRPMNELSEQTKNIFEKNPIKIEQFTRQIAFNVIPQVGEILEDGFSYEEFKIIKEIQKIVSEEIKIIATSVRVPVMVGHGISLAIEFEKSISVEEVKNILSSRKGVKLSSDDYTTPVEAEGHDDVFVGRIRRDPTVSHGILLWLVADNLRRGAALDEAEIAERILAL
jgi:aspartate-semialdehyde dehydrogenase